MRTLKVAVIGHMVALPNEIDLPPDPEEGRLQLQLHNFTRVATEEGKLVDHLAYLKHERQLGRETEFSVWEMWLCATLLLGSHLRRNGCQVLLVNYIDTDNDDREFARLRAFAPDVVCLSTTFVLTRRHLCDIGRRLRAELPATFIVAGGHHVFTTLLHMNDEQRARYLTSSRLNAFVNDTQGESAILEVCKHFPDDLDRVPNLLWRRRTGEIVQNPRVAEENDINSTLIDLDGVSEGSIVHIRTARSCSFKCAFCSYPTIAGELALMEVDNAILTLKQCVDHKVGAVVFVDDTFNVPKPRFETLLDRMIAEGLSVPWYSFLRCQYVDEQLVGKMRRSGCRGVFLGVESGSDAILKKMKKGAIIRFYWDGLRWLRDNGIVTVGSFIVGYPGETAATAQETQDFIVKSGLDYYFLQPFYYLHHTPIHQKAEKYHLTGEGLRWTHSTMHASEALQHLNRMFLEIQGSTFINPDYTLWEIAYLRSKGMRDEEIKRYRETINSMTQSQMRRFDLSSGAATSRDAAGT